MRLNMCLIRQSWYFNFMFGDGVIFLFERVGDRYKGIGVFILVGNEGFLNVEGRRDHSVTC